jgi:hypothetical protein
MRGTTPDRGTLDVRVLLPHRGPCKVARLPTHELFPVLVCSGGSTSLYLASLVFFSLQAISSRKRTTMASEKEMTPSPVAHSLASKEFAATSTEVEVGGPRYDRDLIELSRVGKKQVLKVWLQIFSNQRTHF